MEIHVLGSGTSQGVPIIGCKCDVCLSGDLRDKRLRSSVYICYKGLKILIDIGPDFRQQMLRQDLDDIDCILLTHEHNDHVGGLDDVRPINFLHKKAIPIYALPRVIRDVKHRYAYAFHDNPYPGTPQLQPIEINEKILDLGNDVLVNCIPVMHGHLEVLSFRLGGFAYVCDVSKISDESYAALQNLDVLVISALHHRPHPAHFTLKEALEAIEIIKPKSAYITHLSHENSPPKCHVGYRWTNNIFIIKNMFIRYWIFSYFLLHLFFTCTLYTFLLSLYNDAFTSIVYILYADAYILRSI
jgi:phosphoribosyl 1,2-cyclic phosphate phosphodiesterase